MTSSIYIVTQGEYSDYHICALFSTHEVAAAFVQLLKEKHPYAHEPEIEEWPLDATVDHIKRGEMLYSLTMFRSGDSNPHISSDYGGDEVTALRKDRREKYFLCVARWARQPEDVVKIANEIRARMIATGEWPDDPTTTTDRTSGSV